MKILWVNANFLHPTTKGGQIRTLEMLKRLNARHEVHYAAFADASEPEGPQRAPEYSSKHYVVNRHLPKRRSPAFFAQVAAGVFSSVPVAVGRFYSHEMEALVRQLQESENFDCMVCDFLVSAVHFPHLERAVLFQHNVESVIWKRHAEHGTDAARRWFFGLQASRMLRYEEECCRRAAYVITVSPLDTQLTRELYGIQHVSDISTGVDLEYFAPRAVEQKAHDLVFVGSMDWMPNVDGVQYFVREILPLIRRKLPGCSLAVVGRKPDAAILALAEADPAITITGTVPDVRPYLWNSKLSIVPLRIGGGTRLKVYESMAARVPVVSTTIGAEGLVWQDGENIAIGDTPEAFAQRCIDLLDNSAACQRMAESGWNLVSSRFSWEQVTRQFEDLMMRSKAARVA
jgi:glycosyltransferase involved in cell wall biosynthesis